VLHHSILQRSARLNFHIDNMPT